jgi:malonyl-CoA decarboxylase
LEKIIRYEAVHEIADWADLRRRIDPPDRRCFAFFHPCMTDEPLIFVEVALTREVPEAIAPLLAPDRRPTSPADATTAVFYSISNCQRGLAGVSFGHFLIKQVVEELKCELPRLATFATLSPVPGFGAWLAAERCAPASRFVTPHDKELLDRLEPLHQLPSLATEPELRRALSALVAAYLLRAKAVQRRPIDPVARFHLGNGARLERINWMGDTSKRALRHGCGFMVNYLYDPATIVENHEAYANHAAVQASSAVRRLLRHEAPSEDPPLPAAVCCSTDMRSSAHGPHTGP